ncbi:hypothetical protein Q8F55_005256 [Vanrija albida]|uniref:Uncharacterized protein n=1 Tax=Vanrija albida TaxID=181172 RepID=A0ABR3Q145_9TREE
MLARRLAAGPSRALLARFASTATAEVQHAQQQTPSPSSRPSSSAQRARTPRVPLFTASTKNLERLISLTEQAHKTQAERGEIWYLYSGLTPAQQLDLSTEHLRAILRSVVPRFDDAWRVANYGSKRQRFENNRRESKRWEWRLRTILDNLVARREADIGDWLFTLNALATVGHVKGCEGVVAQMPDEIKNNRTVSGLRLGAVLRWTRHLNEARASNPSAALVDLAHNAFWDIFRGIQSSDMAIWTVTLNLLLTSTSELTNLLVKLGNPDAITRFDGFMRFLLKEGYGIDLDDLPASLQSRDPTRAYAALSAQGLNAVLKQLAIRGTDPYTLLRAYDLLSTDTRDGAVLADDVASAYGNEDADDFVPGLSGLTAAEEAGDGTPKRDYFGGLGANASFFGSSVPDAPGSADGEVSQRRRRVADFFPQPTAPQDVVPGTAGTYPSKARSDANSVLVLLEAICKSANWNLFERVLQVSLVDAQQRQSEWFAAYLACPQENRKQLFKPMRVSPEWFRVALGYSNREFGRGATRLAFSIENALKWIDQEIDVVIATEARLAKEAAAAATTVDAAGRTTLPLPDFATDPRAKQRAVNREIFIASDALKTLYDDRDKLQHHLSRAIQLRDKRAEREVARRSRAEVARARRALTDAKVAEQAARKAALEEASLAAATRNVELA